MARYTTVGSRSRVDGPLGLIAITHYIAQTTLDAYSFDRYANWQDVISQLLCSGYTPTETAAILRSKYMRWAADAADRGEDEATAGDLIRWMQQNKISKNDIAQLVADTF